MAKNRVRMHGGKKEDLEPNKMQMDRLSALPDPIIHHILSFVPTIYAVRMSLLSKRWRHMWYGLPVLQFSDSVVGNFKSQKLCTFVGKCLKLRKNDMLNVTDTTITKFKLHTRYTWSNTDGWLKLVAKSNNIKELDLCISRSSNVYCLPLDVLRVRSLTHLRLSRIVLKDLNSSSLPSLISLSLVSVSLDDQALHNLLLGSCSLEKLLLDSCLGLLNPEVLSLSLKFLEINSCRCETLQVAAVNLESFLCNGRHTVFELNLFPCETLRNLTLILSTVKDQRLKDLIFRLPCLESLTLHCYSKWKRINICSQHLKHFSFIVHDVGIYKDMEIVIQTPNLSYFDFQGHPMVNISMNIPNLLEANVKLFATSYDLSWYINLLDFLSDFDCSINLGLLVYSREALIFPNKLRKVCRAPLPNVRHLKVKTCSPLLRNNDLKDSLFWATPSLQTLSIEQKQGVWYLL